MTTQEIINGVILLVVWWLSGFARPLGCWLVYKWEKWGEGNEFMEREMGREEWKLDKKEYRYLKDKLGW